MNIPDNPDMTVERFIQAYAKLMVGWGMPLTAARILAYMMLQPKPVGLDQIATALEISKASAWGATRHLERVNQIERFGEPGSKRALFAPIDDIARSLFNYSRLLSRSGTLMRDAAQVAAGPEAAARLRHRSEAYLSVHEAIESTVEELMAERRKAAAG
jgi:DNA-binding transcriptional regulator GbsR (MarR family)